MDILTGLVVVVAASALIGFAIRNHTDISHLPKFSGIIHYTCNDKWSFSYKYGDIILKVKNSSGRIHDIYIVGHLNTVIKLNDAEIKEFNRQHPSCKLEIEERSE